MNAKKIGMLIGAAGSLLFFVWASFVTFFGPPKPLPPEVQNALFYVKQQLMDERGIIETYPRLAKKIPFRDSYQRESLSETVGLWMLILEKLNLQTEFDQQVRMLKSFFLLSNGTLSWRLNNVDKETFSPEPNSATIDDLRIIRALLHAWKRWHKEEYKIFALSLAAAMKQRAIYQGCLLEQPILNQKHNLTTVDLSYLDLEAMKMLSKYDSEWQSIYERSIQILLEGQRANGLFYDKYDVYKKHYFDLEKNFINQLLCAIHLAEQRIDVKKLTAFLKAEWSRDKKLQGVYNLDTGKAETDYESSVVYALAYRLAKLVKDKGLAEEMRQRIIKHNSSSKDPLWKGSLGQNGGHVFDHLQILLDWTLYKEAFWL